MHVGRPGMGTVPLSVNSPSFTPARAPTLLPLRRSPPTRTRIAVEPTARTPRARRAGAGEGAGHAVSLGAGLEAAGEPPGALGDAEGAGVGHGVALGSADGR